MRKQASPTVIGGFVIGAVILAVLGITFLGGGEFLKEKSPYVLYFDESVKGLETGAAVTFRGITVGKVTAVRAIVDPRTLTFGMEVRAEIESSRFTVVSGESIEEAIGERDVARELINRGLRGQLESKSIITGQLIVNLDFHPETPIKLHGHRELAEIPTIPSTMGEFTKKLMNINLDELSAKLTSLVDGVNNKVNSPEVDEIIATLNQALKHLDQLIVNVDNQVEPLAAGAQGTLKDFSTLARNADKEIKPLTAKARKGIEDIQTLVNNVNGEIKPLSTKAQGALVQGRKTLATAEGLIKEDSPLIYNAEVTLKELSAAARAIRVWAQYLERHPEALVRGRGGRR
jgi:paraquat-inducible protein B